MTKVSKSLILEEAALLFAENGLSTFSTRKLAKRISISHSVIYHYFEDEKELLLEMFNYARRDLGKKRSLLPQTKDAQDMLKQRIEFQIDNAAEIVAILKYYLAHRTEFKKNSSGFVPESASKHIVEALERGVNEGEFVLENIKNDAKVITHAINGFLLEYYPHKPKGKEKTELIDLIHNFLMRALKGGDK